MFGSRDDWTPRGAEGGKSGNSQFKTKPETAVTDLCFEFDIKKIPLKKK